MPANENQQLRELYEFGPFRVDSEKEILLRAGEPIPLQPKTFQILLVLVRHNRELVTKDDLMKTVWPDTFVEETNLSRNIFMLRKALGESPQDHQYILTVPGRGYRLAENVRLVPEQELSIVAATHSKVRVEITEAKPWGWFLLGAIAVLAVGAGTIWFLHRRNPVLTEKDTIVLADFINTTGDAVFDGTLRQGLAIQLEQSPFLKIMDEEQVQRGLRLMSIAPASHITNQIAHDICIRDGAAATIAGSIESLGKNYVITLQATTCRGGVTLAREQIQAGDKEHVLTALGTAGTAMRAKLGESLSSIQKLNRPLEQATTPSLEALQNYTVGFSEMGQGQFLAAIPMFERSIELDPNFAMAYFMLGVAFENAGDVERSREYTQKAFGLVDRVSEFERDLITPIYYSYDGQSDKAIDAYRLGIQSYPRFWGFHNDLSTEDMDLGQFEEGLKEGQEATGLEASVEPPYRRQLDAYMCLNRLAISGETAGPGTRRSEDPPALPRNRLRRRRWCGRCAGDSMVCRQAGGVPQFWLAGGQSECTWPAPRVEQAVPTSCGDSAATRTPECRRGIRRGRCACRRAVG